MTDTITVLCSRIDQLTEGLDVTEACKLLEELFDEYTAAVFGVSIIGELHKVKMAGDGNTSTIQTLANGRLVLSSSYGFTVKSESKYPDGRTFLVLEENSKEDFNRRRKDNG